jgi:predicted anti-sigma-YlaC factor YlaD
MMNCKDFKELLSAYADGELSLTQTDFIEEHLSACPDCVAALNSYKETNMMITSLRKIQAMPDIKDATMSKIKIRQYVKPSRKWLRPALIAIAVTGLIAAIFIADTKGNGTGGGVMAPPPGFLAMQGKIINNSAYIKKAAGYTSIILAITGIVISILHSIIGNISFLLITGPLYLYAIILGIVAVTKRKVNKWAINAGIILCILNSIISAIIFIDHSTVLVIAAIVIPIIIILFAYRESIYTGIKSLVFHRGITWSPRKWLRPAAMIAGTAVLLLAAT